ncbi:MAG: hypothetical protein IH916_06320 [Acidobacteria bacterium]|nr:hypothetical protein [Acidobacteriota bacterium]
MPMLENVQTGIDGVGRIAVSNVGNVAYLKGSGAGARELVWVTRDGDGRPLPVDPKNVLGVRLSPDGKTLALTIPDIQPVRQMSIRYQLNGANGKEVDGELLCTIHGLAPSINE